MIEIIEGFEPWFVDSLTMTVSAGRLRTSTGLVIAHVTSNPNGIIAVEDRRPDRSEPRIVLHEEIGLDGWRRRIAAMKGGPVPPRA